jgi:hypothetical protein
MADFGQDDEVVSKPAAATTKSSWGSNDDVVTPTAPATSASAPIDSGGGAAFGMYPKPGMKPMQPGETSSAGAFAASAAESVAATPGVLAGSRAAMAVTPPVMPYVGTLAKPIAGIVGGIGGGILASMGIKSLEQFADTVFGTNIVGIREQQQKESPTASLLGQVAGGSMNPWMRPTIPSSAGQALAGGGIMGVVGAGQRLIHGEDVFDPTAMAVDVGTGMFTKPTQRGERLLGITPTTTTKKTTVGDLPEKPPEGATPEEKATYVEKLKTIKTERDAKAPLVEAAIRNKSTGEIERMGPKHDQARKDATKDTHEEGFVDERGNFHERQVAVDQAKRAGQIPEDHVLENPPGERPGLHSGDLRKVGDERFAITEDQPAGVPKEPKATRADFKEAIDVNEAKRMGLEAQAEEAARVGDEARVTSINEQIKALEQEHAQLTKDMPSQETLAYERSDVQEYANRHSTTTGSTKEAFVDWLHKSELPLDPAKIGEYEKQFMADVETPKEKIITSSSDEPTVEKDPKAKELANVIRKVAAAEKQSDPKDWTPEERAAYDKGWEEFSRVRGYSEQEIADFKKYRELTGEMISKYGEDAVMEFDMLVTKGEHPDFSSIKGSVDVADRMAAATSEPVAKAFEKVDPRSMPSEEAMLNHATDIYERYGEKDAIQFFDDYKKNLNERSIPVPNNNEQLDDGMHKMNTFTVKDESEHVIGYKESTEAGVTAEDRAQAFLDRENGKPILGRLGEILKGIWDENLALVRKIKAMGGDVGEEYTTGQSRIRMWTDKNAKQDKEQPVGFKAKVKDFLSNETVKKFFSNDTPMGDKFAEQADAAIERKVFQTDDGRVIELHRQPEDTRVKLPDGKYREIKKGTEIWEWKDGRKQLIGHSDNLQLKRGDKFETKKFSDKLSEGPDVGTASEKRTLKPELTIIDGKVPEIERHSPYRYLHDAEASARIANMGLRKMARELEFIENLKKSELFKQVGHGPDQDPKTLPRHYVEPQSLSRIPQLRGWAFDPKTAAIIEDFAKVWDNNMYMKLSNALVKNMMLNPIPHMFNEVMHLWNARGFTGWVDPRQLGSFADTARVAWRDVGNQTQFYRDIMREGGSILGASPRNKGYFDTIIKDASKEMFGTPEMERSMKGLAKKLGTSVGDLYNGISEASQKAMWFTRDVMYVQLVREIMARQEKSGNKLTLKEAIDQAERHMPNYRLPSEVLGSRGVSKVLRDPRVSMFSRYHYGMVKSLVNTLKDVDPRNLKTPEGRQHFREGVDSMIAIGIAMNVLYPLMDKMAEAVFGEGAEQRRAGPFHLIQAGLDVYDKKKDASALIWPVFTFNPMLLTLGQLGLNKKAFTGKSIYHPDDDFGTIMGDIGAYTAGQIPQVPPIMSATADEEGQTKLLARQFDIKVETEAEKQRKERAKKYQQTSKTTRDRQREKETYRR